MLRSMLFLRLFTIIPALKICIVSGALFDSLVRSNNDISLIITNMWRFSICINLYTVSDRNCPLFTCRDAESRKAVSVTYSESIIGL